MKNLLKDVLVREAVENKKCPKEDNIVMRPGKKKAENSLKI